MVEGPAKTVLMADDDPEDCWLATKAFAEGGATAASPAFWMVSNL